VRDYSLPAVRKSIFNSIKYSKIADSMNTAGKTRKSMNLRNKKILVTGAMFYWQPSGERLIDRCARFGEPLFTIISLTVMGGWILYPEED